MDYDVVYNKLEKMTHQLNAETLVQFEIISTQFDDVAELTRLAAELSEPTSTYFTGT